MSVTPPIGFGTWTTTFQADGSSRTATNTWGFRNVGGYTAAGARGQMDAAMFGTGHLYVMTELASEWTHVSVYTLINQGGVLFSDELTVGVAGSDTKDAISPNVSLVIAKLTAQAGKAYRGRVAFPAGYIDEGDVDVAGVYDAAQTGIVQGRATSSFNACAAQGVPLYLIHGVNKAGTTPNPTEITSLNVERTVGTQRRRVRR